MFGALSIRFTRILLPAALALSPLTEAIATTPAPPTFSEIELIESRVDMPGDAGPIEEYVRFYYVDPELAVRTIQAGYVSRSLFDVFSMPMPSSNRVLVRKFEDIPIAYDAGCSIVTVTFSPERGGIPGASCDSTLELWPEPAIPGWMYALIPLAPVAGFLLFLFKRFRPRRDSAQHGVLGGEQRQEPGHG
jgi:hypothetical protein